MIYDRKNETSLTSTIVSCIIFYFLFKRPPRNF